MIKKTHDYTRKQKHSFSDTNGTIENHDSLKLGNGLQGSCDMTLSGVHGKVQVGNDQEKAQSEKDSHSKNRGGKKPN